MTTALFYFQGEQDCACGWAHSLRTPCRRHVPRNLSCQIIWVITTFSRRQQEFGCIANAKHFEIPQGKAPNRANYFKTSKHSPLWLIILLPVCKRDWGSAETSHGSLSSSSQAWRELLRASVYKATFLPTLTPSPPSSPINRQQSSSQALHRHKPQVAPETCYLVMTKGQSGSLAGGIIWKGHTETAAWQSVLKNANNRPSIALGALIRMCTS